MAHLFYDAGLITIVALVSPYDEDRNQAKYLFPESAFAEVWFKTPPTVCAERDPKGLYKKAASGQLPNLTGVGQEYEEPDTAELVLDGTLPVEENLEHLLQIVLD